MKKWVLFLLTFTILSFDAKSATKPFDTNGKLKCTPIANELKRLFNSILFYSPNPHGLRTIDFDGHYKSFHGIHVSVPVSGTYHGFCIDRNGVFKCGWKTSSVTDNEIRLFKNKISSLKNKCNKIYAYKVAGEYIKKVSLLHARFGGVGAGNQTMKGAISCLQNLDPDTVRCP